jgi:hypothetical protein
MRESDVREHLDNQVLIYGGTTRATKYLGKKNCPDVLLLFPLVGKHAFVETKRPGKAARPGQEREHGVLNDAGITTVVLDTKEGIDEFLATFLKKKRIKQ